MQGWGADGEPIFDFRHLRRISIVEVFLDRDTLPRGKYEIFVDDHANSMINCFLDAFDLPAVGDFAVPNCVNIVKLCKVLRNLLHNHEMIFGTRVKNICDPNFCVFLPSFKSVLEHISWKILETNECSRLIYNARMASFRCILTPEEFFRMFPSTGCPYVHCWDDEKEDVESTCTLCEGYQSSSEKCDHDFRFTPLQSRHSCFHLDGIC